MTRALATCHPDRPMHGHGLCRLCYREQRKATRAAVKLAAPTPISAAKGSSRTSSKPTSSTSADDKPLTAPKPAPKPSAKKKPSPKARATSRPDLAVVDVGSGPEEAEVVDERVPTIVAAEVAVATATFPAA